MSTVKDFRVLLFQLADDLTDHDVVGIRSIEDLPVEFEKKSALQVLLKLETEGKISATDLSSLEVVFKNIKRLDLVKKVKDYGKSLSKSRRKAIKKPEVNSLINAEVKLHANLEVAVAQMRLLLDQL